MSGRWAVTAVFAINGASYGAWATRVPWVKDRLDLSAGRLGIALGVIAIGSLVAMPVAGALSARLGSLAVTRTAAVAFLLATPLPVLAPSFPALVAATFLLGAAAGSLDVAMNAHGVAVERAVERPALAGMHAAFSGGGLVGAAVGAVAAGADVDARLHLGAVSVLGAVTLTAVWRALASPGPGRAAAGPMFARPTGALWTLGAVAFCCLLAEGAAADWSAVYLDEDLATDPGTAGAGYVAFSACMLAGRLAGDPLVARLGARRVLGLGGAIAGGGLAAALALGHPAAALAGFALLGLGLAGVVPVVFRAAANTGEVAEAPALAAVSTLGYTGFLAGPPIVGAVAEAASLPWGLLLVAAAAAAPLPLAVLAGGRLGSRAP